MGEKSMEPRGMCFLDPVSLTLLDYTAGTQGFSRAFPWSYLPGGLVGTHKTELRPKVLCFLNVMGEGGGGGGGRLLFV